MLALKRTIWFDRQLLATILDAGPIDSNDLLQAAAEAAAGVAKIVAAHGASLPPYGKLQHFDIRVGNGMDLLLQNALDAVIQQIKGWQKRRPRRQRPEEGHVLLQEPQIGSADVSWLPMLLDAIVAIMVGPLEPGNSILG